MSVRLKKTDRGYRKLLETLDEIKRKPGVSVGVHAAEGSEVHEGGDFNDDTTVLEVAYYNEFGLGVPERSFIRAWFDDTKAANHEAMARLMRQVLKNKMTVADALELLGLRFAGDVQKRMAQGIPPPNSPATIAAKGSSTPLIDSGQLRQSVTHLARTKVS